MKKKPLIICLFLFICFHFLSTVHLFSQNEEKAEIEKILLKHEEQINKWENSGSLLMVLTILVGTLGVTTGILQKYKFKWCKIATVFAGALISFITIVNHTVFDVDHRTLFSRAGEARKILGDIRIELTRGYNKNNSEERDEWFKKIQDKLHKISDISTKNARINYSIGLTLNQTLHAKNSPIRKPAWLSQLPKDEINLFFMGSAMSQSLKQAKDYSLQDATEAAIMYFKRLFYSKQTDASSPINIDLLSSFLANSTKIEDTYYYRNERSRMYHYFTLLRIAKNTAKMDMKIFSIKKKTHLPREMFYSMQNVKDSSEKYFSERFQMHRNFLKESLKMLTPDEYENFMKARSIRKSDNPDPAIPMLERIIESKPAFYYAWYELALVLDTKGDFERADQTYMKSIELERRQDTRDPSLYFAYGTFLYKQRHNPNV